MKKQVLIIGPGMEIGGVERSLLGLLDAIDYNNYDVDLFLLSHTGEFMPYINEKAKLLPENKNLALINMSIISLFRRKHFKIAALRLFSKLYGDLRGKAKGTVSINITLCKKLVTQSVPQFKKHYDFALGFFGPHYLLNDKVDAKIKIGWVHTDYTNSNERLDVQFLLPMWDRLDWIACVSEGVEKSFQKVFPELKDKTLTVENILSGKLIKKQAKEIDVSQEMPDDGSVKLLSVGRFSTAKNFDTIPEVCRNLVNRGYRIKWFLIGYGADENLIRKKIHEYAVDDTVIILGKKVNPYPYINACDIYVQPSRYEGKAVTVREAQILHKPVMITRFVTSSDQLQEGVDGYICEQGVEGIIEGICSLIDYPERRIQLSENTEGYDYENIKEIEKVWSLYEG